MTLHYPSSHRIVLDALERLGPSTLAALEQATRQKRNTLRGALQVLRSEGIVANNGSRGNAALWRIDEATVLADWHSFRWGQRGVLVAVSPEGRAFSMGGVFEGPPIYAEVLRPSGRALHRQPVSSVEEGQRLVQKWVANAGGRWLCP